MADLAWAGKVGVETVPLPHPRKTSLIFKIWRNEFMMRGFYPFFRAELYCVIPPVKLS